LGPNPQHSSLHQLVTQQPSLHPLCCAGRLCGHNTPAACGPEPQATTRPRLLAPPPSLSRVQIRYNPRSAYLLTQPHNSQRQLHQRTKATKQHRVETKPSDTFTPPHTPGTPQKQPPLTNSPTLPIKDNTHSRAGGMPELRRIYRTWDATA